MATLPVFRTWVAGEIVVASYFNTNVRDPGNFWLARPLAVLRQVTPQSIPNNTWTPILMDTEDLDRDNGHSLVTNTSRYTSQTAGYYLSLGQISFGTNSSGMRGAQFYLNGTVVNYGAALMLPVPSATTGLVVPPAYINLPLTQYLEIFGYHNITGGGALSTVAGSNFQLLWVSS